MTFKGKRAASKADTVEITCPACSNTWSFDASKEDLTTDKTCAACGHTWTPVIQDYAKAIEGPVSRARIDVAAVFATRNRETVGRASATDPAALYRERNARGGK
jgi:hypothetical protein